MRVADLHRPKPVEATVDIGDGDTITLTFDRNRITPAWLNSHQEQANTRNAGALGEALSQVLIEWDVYNNAPGDYPPTADNLNRLSLPTQNALFDMILELAIPARAEGNDLRTTSSSPVTDYTNAPATPQNGLVPSTSPPPLASPSPT